MPKFSVVIAVFNKEKYLKKTLESVLNQTHPDFEIIIVNDGSSDESQAVIQNFKDARIHYYFQENKGAGAARNAAVNFAKSDYIALLDADDFWDPGYLEAIAGLIEKFPHEKVFATACNVQQKKKIQAPVYSIENLKANEIRKVDFFESSYINSVLTSSSTVLHRDVFERVGYYDPSIKSGQDTDLWIRIGLQYKVVFQNTPYATYIYSPLSLSNTTSSIENKLNLMPYEETAKTNKGLKKFLDLNHYSLAVLAKRAKDKVGFLKHASKIDLNNLNSKQRHLLNAPTSIVRILFGFKGFLEKFGIILSAFK